VSNYKLMKMCVLKRKSVLVVQQIVLT